MFLCLSSTNILFLTERALNCNNKRVHPQFFDISKFLVGANSCWRPGTCPPLGIANRRQETAPAEASECLIHSLIAGSCLQHEPYLLFFLSVLLKARLFYAIKTRDQVTNQNPPKLFVNRGRLTYHVFCASGTRALPGDNSWWDNRPRLS